MWHSWQITLSLAGIALSASIPDFGSWPHGRIKTNDGSIAFRYYGNGPPVILVHGNPEYSLTWQYVGPIIASHNYTVICPDNRGAGDSQLATSDNYTAAASATDLYALTKYLKINQTYVFSHDKGVGHAVALAAKHSDLVARLGIAEYPLPGYGYENFWAPTYDWSLYSNWQLAFFSIPDAASFFISGREEQMLSWYFYHSSYSGPESVSQDTLAKYTSSISKPGFLRAMLKPFEGSVIGEDAAFFKGTVGLNPLKMPVLALGGEASLAPKSEIQELFNAVAKNLTVDVVPKAGHWIADENPNWLAQRLIQFFDADEERIPPVDLSWLDITYTLLEQGG